MPRTFKEKSHTPYALKDRWNIPVFHVAGTLFKYNVLFFQKYILWADRTLKIILLEQFHDWKISTQLFTSLKKEQVSRQI